MNLNSQRKLAAKILKVGENKIYLDPKRLEDISRAITREDIRDLIKEKAIYAKRKKGSSRGRIRQKKQQRKKGRRKGYGSKKGTKNARKRKKEKWMNKIRAIRDELRKLKKENKINEKEYRQLYKQSKGGTIQSRRHLREQLERIRE